MATKPTVGGSDGTWGTELNAHLDVSLDADGKVDDGASQTTSAAPGADAELVNKKYSDTRGQPVAKIYLGSEQTNLTDDTDNLVELDTSATNFDSSIATLTGTFKLTPAVDGLYLVIGQVTYNETDADSIHRVLIYKNGGAVAQADIHTTAGVLAISPNVTTLLYLDTDDYVQLYAHPGGSGNQTDISANEARTYLALYRVGDAVP